MFSYYTAFDGSIYASGLNDQSQLGLVTGGSGEDAFKAEETVLTDRQVVYISGGHNHSLATIKEHSRLRIYSWGMNKHQQLGHLAPSSGPLPVSASLPPNIYHLACSAYSSLATTGPVPPPCSLHTLL